MKMVTPQNVKYNQLDCGKILIDLMKKKGNLVKNYAQYITDLESENLENVNHYK